MKHANTIIPILFIANIFLIATGLSIAEYHEEVKATGGGTELAKIIIPLLQEAQQAQQNNDPDAVAELLQEAIEQLQDSYSAEEADKNDG